MRWTHQIWVDTRAQALMTQAGIARRARKTKDGTDHDAAWVDLDINLDPQPKTACQAKPRRDHPGLQGTISAARKASYRACVRQARCTRLDTRTLRDVSAPVFSRTLWATGNVEISRDEWLATAVIAGLRVASNQARAPHRSRGAQKNLLNDIQGVAGELLAIRILEAEYGAGQVEHAILHWSGGTGEVQEKVDIVIRHRSWRIRLEGKCHLDEDNKRMFLVNRTAHQRSAARGAVGYLPVLGVLGRATARVGRLVEHAELDGWEPHNYGYDDVALRRPLREVAPEIFAAEWEELRASLRSSPEAAGGDTIRGLARGAMNRFEELRGSSFELAGLAHTELIERALAESRACWKAR
ncbi:MAG TPA: hypothetical protein VKB25_05320 [Conexibacter sp.]|nr:hypothetical protein [Conexibacter sp.]